MELKSHQQITPIERLRTARTNSPNSVRSARTATDVRSHRTPERPNSVRQGIHVCSAGHTLLHATHTKAPGPAGGLTPGALA